MIRGRALKPEDILVVARRRVAILVPFLVITLGTFAYVRRMPDRYRSETVILVVPQRIPESFVRATVTTRIQDRLQSLNQEIMSRTRLEPVINEFKLYPRLVGAGLMEDAVARMRREAVAQVVRGDAFRISYEAADPRTAMKVTERLASMYIDENLRDREILADGTNQFLESQLAAAKERLLESEKRLEEYNRQYRGELPAQLSSNLQVLQGAQLQIQALIDSIRRDKDRQLVLEGILADSGADSSLASPGSTVLDAPPAAVAGQAPNRLGAAMAAVNAATLELEEMQRRLKPEHPDVIRQKRLVADLQKALDVEVAAASQRTPGAPPVIVDRVEAARFARIQQTRTELTNLKASIAQKENEEARLRGVVGEYQRRVEAAPTRDSEMIELTRDYGTIQRSYQNLLTKKEEAQIAANLERYQIGEQFKILDPARLPERPFSPDRPRIYALGAVAGLGLGIALAVFLEFRDTTMKTDADVVMTLGLPVLAMIPELITSQEKSARRRRRALLSFATAGAAAAVGGILFWVFRGSPFSF